MNRMYLLLLVLSLVAMSSYPAACNPHETRHANTHYNRCKHRSKLGINCATCLRQSLDPARRQTAAQRWKARREAAVEARNCWR